MITFEQQPWTQPSHQTRSTDFTGINTTSQVRIILVEGSQSLIIITITTLTTQYDKIQLLLHFQLTELI